MTAASPALPVIEPPHPLSDATRLGLAELAVSDLGRSTAFYQSVVGLDLFDRTRSSATLGGKGGRAILRLVEEPGATPTPSDVSGLFHVALLLPERRDLATAFARLTGLGVLTGASDHRVSEALYLDDPDGNGIEIYRDRPREDWPNVDGRLAMATDPIDRDGLLKLSDGRALDEPAPADVTLGHVHLKVADLRAAEDFWVRDLGFALTTSYPGALFMGAGGYHHHIAANIWRSRGRSPQADGHAGLRSFEVILPDANDIEAVRSRLPGAAVSAGSGATLRVREPSGAEVVFRTGDADGSPR